MFKGERGAGELNGFLDAGSHLQGDLAFEDTFRVDGRITGTIRSEGDLVVGEQGEVDAEVEVGRLFVSGTLRGTARAARKIELSPTARVEATLTSPALVIEEGATVDGRCVAGSHSAVGAQAEGGPAKESGDAATKKKAELVESPAS